jgi:hypothetical protein
MFTPIPNAAILVRNPKMEPYPPEELCRDCQKGQWNWDMHLAREEIHRTCEPKAAEPTQHLLCTVSKKDNP